MKNDKNEADARCDFPDSYEAANVPTTRTGIAYCWKGCENLTCACTCLHAAFAEGLTREEYLTRRATKGTGGSK